MLRKVTLGLVAAGAVAMAALAPVSASAAGHGGHGGGHGGHGGWHGGGHGGGHGGWHSGFRPGPRFVGSYGAYASGGGGCMVRRLVATPWGYRYRLVNRCY